MPALALIAVLLAAVTHSTWNLYAKKAAGSRHFVWLYSVGSIVLYLPIIAWIMVYERPHLGAIECLALTATAVLHTGYSLVLQAGYRTSDLSLVYPIARGSGPLLSFVGATILLGERPTVLAGLGLVLIVAGILLVAGLTREPHRAPKAGIFFGLLTGSFYSGLYRQRRLVGQITRPVAVHHRLQRQSHPGGGPYAFSLTRPARGGS